MAFNYSENMQSCHYDVLGCLQIVIFIQVVTDAYPCYPVVPLQAAYRLGPELVVITTLW